MAKKRRSPRKAGAKSGRPVGLTKTIEDKLCRLLRAGLRPPEACVMAGAHKTTYYRWLKAGRALEPYGNMSADRMAAFASAIDTALTGATLRAYRAKREKILAQRHEREIKRAEDRASRAFCREEGCSNPRYIMRLQTRTQCRQCYNKAHKARQRATGRKQSPEYRRRRYLELLAAGKCPRCLQDNDRTKGVLCHGCATRTNDKKRQRSKMKLNNRGTLASDLFTPEQLAQLQPWIEAAKPVLNEQDPFDTTGYVEAKDLFS